MFSEGLPRMINIACGQSLATAHRLNHRIQRRNRQNAIFRLAGTPLYRRTRSPRFTFRNPWRMAMLITSCCLLLLMAVNAFLPRQTDRKEVTLRADTKQSLTSQSENPNLPGNPPITNRKLIYDERCL